MKDKTIILSVIFYLALAGLIFFNKQTENFIFSLLGNKSPEFSTADISQNIQKETSITPAPSVSQSPAIPVYGEPVEPTFQAQSAVSLKVNNLGSEQILYQKNIQEKLPIASLTKLMTALIVLENYQLNERIQISKKAILQEGEAGNLKVGESLSVEKLLDIALIESSNDAAYALSEKIDSTGLPQTGEEQFLARMNLKAKELGMVSTNFLNPTGLNGNENYSSGEDLIKLVKYITQNQPKIWETTLKVSTEILNEDGTLHHLAINTNELLSKIPGIIGGKTGYNEEAEGCLILILKDKNGDGYFINIILGSPDRFGEMQKLLQITNQI